MKKQSRQAKAKTSIPREARELIRRVKLKVVKGSSLPDELVFTDEAGEAPAVIRSLTASENEVDSYSALHGEIDIWETSELHTLEISRVATLSALATYARKLRKLRTLRLTWPTIAATTAYDIAPIGDVLGLRDLSLWNCGAKSIAPLARLAKLRVLEIGGDTASLPLEDLSPLRTLENLTELHLLISKIDDLMPLSGLSKLKTLSIQHSPVTNLKPLSKLHNLRQLSFYWTAASDLKPLEKLTQLKSLEITPATKIDSAQRSRIQQKLPNCRFHFVD
ncbi:MAG: hypothetical protein AAFU85_00510 [Planctomycetota bacterium]